MFFFSIKFFIISAALPFFYTHSHSLKINDWNLLSLLLISVQYDDDKQAICTLALFYYYDQIFIFRFDAPREV